MRKSNLEGRNGIWTDLGSLEDNNTLVVHVRTTPLDTSMVDRFN